MTPFSPETVQRFYKVIAVLLFIDYGIFMIGYFFLPDFNLQYKYFIRPLHALVLPGIVIDQFHFRFCYFVTEFTADCLTTGVYSEHHLGGQLLIHGKKRG